MAPATLGLRASRRWFAIVAAAAGADGWISLLNGHDLTGWYPMMEKSGKDVAQSRKIVMMEQDMLHVLGNEVEIDVGLNDQTQRNHNCSPQCRGTSLPGQERLTGIELPSLRATEQRLRRDCGRPGPRAAHSTSDL